MSRARGSLMGDIMAAAATLDTFTKAEMSKLLGRGTTASVGNAVQSLFQEGYLERVCPRVYQKAPNPPDRRHAELQDRVWRAIKAKDRYGEPFTIRELRALAEVGNNYAKRLVIFLKDEGLVEFQGQERHPDGVHFSPRYGLTPKGREAKDLPRYKRASAVDKAELARRERLDLAFELAGLLRKSRLGNGDRERIGELLIDIEKRVNGNRKP